MQVWPKFVSTGFNMNDIVKAAQELEVGLLPNEEIKPGDLYLAERNSGPWLLTCADVIDRDNGRPYVIPVDNAYPFDVLECVKVSQ